jgi:predicted MFS family arabinose efflux permease
MMLRIALLAMTTIAVVSDTMLLPYYPQLFVVRFGISSPVTVGAYLASISLAVMLAFPAWVAIARRHDTIAVLIWTQLAAAGFSVACYMATDIASFWVSSIVMVCFKASYLLMYPYVIAMQPVDKHAATIGALAVIVHFGGIVGAVSGGHVVGSWGYALPYVVMGLGDIIQAGICAVLLKTASVARARQSSAEDTKSIVAVTREDKKSFASLLIVMFFFYFGFYMSMPFMTVWWQSVAGGTSPDLAGIVYAIPGFVALAILAHGFWRGGGNQVWRRNEIGLVLTGVGLAIQAVPDQACIITGRIIYGIGLYRVTIGLDALFFERAQKAHYASGFSLLNIARNSGVMLAALVSGVLSQRFGEGVSFAVAAIVVLATLFLYRVTLRPNLGSAGTRPQLA